MATGFLLNRSVLTLGIHSQRVCRNVSLSQVREMKRWMKAYTFLMAKKLKLEGPPPPKPRYGEQTQGSAREHLKATHVLHV